MARTRISQAGVGAMVEDIVQADARDLSLWAGGSFDAVLFLGPFYQVSRLRSALQRVNPVPLSSSLRQRANQV
jgi:hypothetical protein